jgi:hypothetical protein
LIYVNLPNSLEIGVVQISKLKLINEWNKAYREGNFPMALDSQGDQLFVGYRHPATLVIIDTKTGKRTAVEELTNDTDDLYYDPKNNSVYVSCGGGYVDIFQLQKEGHYKQIAAARTRSGARTSLLIPQLQVFLVCEPSGNNHNADLVVYKTLQ